MLDQKKDNQRTKYRSDYLKDFVFDYKDPLTLSLFISDGGRMISSRVTRLSLAQQRKLKICIKRARVLSLLPMGFEAYNRFGKAEQISAKRFDIDAAYLDSHEQRGDISEAFSPLNQNPQERDSFLEEVHSLSEASDDFPEEFLEENVSVPSRKSSIVENKNVKNKKVEKDKKSDFEIQSHDTSARFQEVPASQGDPHTESESKIHSDHQEKSDLETQNNKENQSSSTTIQVSSKGSSKGH